MLRKSLHSCVDTQFHVCVGLLANICMKSKTLLDLGLKFSKRFKLRMKMRFSQLKLLRFIVKIWTTLYCSLYCWLVFKFCDRLDQEDQFYERNKLGCRDFYTTKYLEHIFQSSFISYSASSSEILISHLQFWIFENLSVVFWPDAVAIILQNSWNLIYVVKKAVRIRNV